MSRVYKPDVKIIMVEHVRSKRIVLGQLMDWLNILNVAVIGEHINRDTEKNVLFDGFAGENIKK